MIYCEDVSGRRCRNKAKWTVVVSGHRNRVCGVHVGWYRRAGIFEITELRRTTGGAE